MKSLLDILAYRIAIDRVVQYVPALSSLKKGILITGASGLIGSAIVDLLLRMKENGTFTGRVIAAGRSVSRLAMRFGVRDGLSCVAYEDVVGGSLSESVDGFVLAASPASPNLFVSAPHEVVKANTIDIEKILQSISIWKDRVVYVSSSEVYGDATAPDGGHHEDSLGRIDTTDARSCYAISKRNAEEICSRFAHKGLDIAVVRPGHVYGPTALPSDRRVSSAWAYSAARGEDIIMKSDGSQLRSYTHCLDCASAILTVLAKGARGGVYNISNKDSIISIKQLAAILASKAGVALRQEIPSAEENAAFNPMVNSSLNAMKIEALGWRGVFDADVGLENTILVLKEVMKEVA